MDRYIDALCASSYLGIADLVQKTDCLYSPLIFSKSCSNTSVGQLEKGELLILRLVEQKTISIFS